MSVGLGASQSRFGNFSDGAALQEGRSYSDDHTCTWTIKALDQSGIVELRIQHWLWPGDVIQVVAADFVLVAQLTSIPPSDGYPPLRALGAMTVTFSTDGNREISHNK